MSGFYVRLAELRTHLCDLWLRARLWCSLRLSISGKRPSSTEVKFLRRHCQKQNECRTQTNLEGLYKLRTAVFCKQNCFPRSAVTNIPTVLSVLPVKRTKRIDLRVCKKINEPELEDQVLNQVRLKSKVTRGFSFSPQLTHACDEKSIKTSGTRVCCWFFCHEFDEKS